MGFLGDVGEFFGDVFETAGKAIGGIVKPVKDILLPASMILGPVIGGKYQTKQVQSATEVQTLTTQQAIKAQSEMLDKQLKFLKEQIAQARSDVAPWREKGIQALNRLYDLMEHPETAPGYKFALEEGIKALDRSAAARGLLRSGAHEKALMRYGQGLALQNYLNYLRPYQSMAGLGQTAAQTLGGYGITGGQAVGNVLANIGQARASGYMGIGNALANKYMNMANIWGGTIGNIGNNLLNWYLLQKILKPDQGKTKNFLGYGNWLW